MGTAAAPGPTQAQRNRQALNVAIALMKRDYEEWARRCYKIRTKQKSIVPLLLRQCQRRLGDVEKRLLKEKGKARIYTLKGRQGGITTDQQARSLHEIWSTDGAQCLTIADTKERVEEIFEITIRAMSHFPSELMPTQGTSRAKEVRFVDKDSRYRVETAGVPEKTAIGTTLSRAHGSEFAHWPEPKAALAAMEPALETPGTVIVLETTASGFGSEGHDVWINAAEMGYECVFIPWWECDPETYMEPLMAPDELGSLSGEEQVLVEAHGLALEQIKWRRRKIRGPGGRNEFLRQYPEDDASCWLAVGGMYYDATDLRMLMQKAPKPIEEHMGGERLVYAKPTPGERYVIGADTAEGVGQDGSTYSVRRFRDWKLMEKYRSTSVTPGGFAEILNDTGRRYNDALLVVEKNMHGITVLRDLRDKFHYPVSSIYHRESFDENAAQAKEKIGWATTGESQPLLLAAGAELFAAAKDGFASVPAAEVTKQALAVRRNEKGKYELTGKDDLVAEQLAWIGRSAPMSSQGMFDAMAASVAAKAAAKEPKPTNPTVPNTPSAAPKAPTTATLNPVIRRM